MLVTITGSFKNPGPLGGFLAITLITSLTILFNDREKTRIISAQQMIALLSSLIIAMGLILADSRAAFIAFIVGLITYFRQTIKKWPSKLVLLIVICFFIGFFFLFKYREESANSRLLIWNVGIEMILEKPILGHGIGNFNKKYMLHQADYFSKHPNTHFISTADNVTYPYNELLYIFIEQGVVGAFFFFALLAVVFIYNSYNKTQKCIQSGISSLLAFSMFSYPTDVMPLFLLFSIFFGLSFSKTLISRKMSHKIKFALMILFLLIIGGTIENIYFYSSADKRVKAFHKFGDIESLNFVLKNKKRLEQSNFFNTIYIKWLTDNQALDELVSFKPTCETYCDIGNLYIKKNNYVEAEKYYKTAALMIPTRLTPNYLLWKMELLRGDTLKAIEIGEFIINQPLKINSSVNN